jgi:asparagine synthetase B (glutamine-hydrolysing)
MTILAGFFNTESLHHDRKILQGIRAFEMQCGSHATDIEIVRTDSDQMAVAQSYKRSNPPLFTPQIDPEGNSLFIFGFIYPDVKSKYPEGLLQVCVERSPDILHDIEGEFVAIFCDARKNRIRIVNDRYASRPFFLSQMASAVVFSSNLAFLNVLTGEKVEPDGLGWIQIFTYGGTIKETTNCQGVHRIEPASSLSISESGLQKKRYWHLDYSPDYDLDPDAHADEAFGALQNSIILRSKMMPHGIVALSGGHDSRLIASGLARNDSYLAFTFSGSDSAAESVEVTTAAAVARQLGLKHVIEPLSINQVSDTARKIVMRNGGLTPLHHPSKTMAIIDFLKRRERKYLLGGGPGNYLAGDSVKSASYLIASQKSEMMSGYMQAKQLAGANTYDTLCSIFKTEFLDAFYVAAEAAYRASFDEFRMPTAAHALTGWEMIYRFSAFTSNSPIHGDSDIMEASSHLDYTYCDLMLKLPVHWLLKKRFYRHMIHRCIPETRDIIIANTGKRLTSQYENLKTGLTSDEQNRYELAKTSPHSGHPPRRGWKRYAKLWTKPILTYLHADRSTIPFSYAIMRNDTKLKEQLMETTHNHPLVRQIVNTSKCDRFIQRFNQGKLNTDSYAQDAELLGSLASLCYTMDLYDTLDMKQLIDSV